MTVPQYHVITNRARMTEVFSLTSSLKAHIQEFYQETGRFPKDNTESGLPAPDKLIGNYIQSVEVSDGAMHVTLGNKIGNRLEGKVISLRPLVVIGSPSSPMSWNCGASKPPNGMKAVGQDRTNISRELLPIRCM